MIKKTMTFENWDGEEVTETFWFHLTPAELAEMEFTMMGGLKQTLQDIVESMDTQQILEKFKLIVSKSIGIRSEDGKRFRKSEEITNDFMESAAYSPFFLELLQDSAFAATFFRGVMPFLPEDYEQKAKIQAKEMQDVVNELPERTALNVFEKLPDIPAENYAPNAVDLPETTENVFEKNDVDPLSAEAFGRIPGTNVRKLEPGDGYTDEEIVNMTREELQIAMQDPFFDRRPNNPTSGG
jgi:hypothetical protein